MIGVLAGTL